VCPWDISGAFHLFDPQKEISKSTSQSSDGNVHIKTK